MADKTTTLKTKTNDNVYPKVIGECRKDSFADSSTITHHFYDKTHKVGFQINNETNTKIQNSLQKPEGLTKTKLVGVGTNGQENIEIGDNLTLTNGKLSATGGGSGGDVFDELIVSEDSTTYTGTITGNKPVLAKNNNGIVICNAVYNNFAESYSIYIDETTSLISIQRYSNGEITVPFVEIQKQTYYHFITLTNNTSTFYLTYQNTSKDKLNTLNSLKTALAGKCLLCTGHTDSENAEYISGEGANIVVGVVDKSDNSTRGITIDSSFTISDLVTPVE